MTQAVILQHVAHEGPGRIVPIFRDYGIPIEIRRLYAGDEVPTDVDELRVLVVMGAPLGVADVDNPRFPFLRDEVALLKRLITEDRPVMGICLGAQLLAHAAGARVYPNTVPGPTPDAPPVPAPEIGWGPIRLPFPGGTEPVLAGVPDGAMMFHWHFDTFDLPRLPTPPPPPAGAPPAPPPPTGHVLMASTAVCRNQAFRFKQRLFGFQFHFEMDQTGIEAMLAHGREDVLKVLGPEGESRLREETARYLPRYLRLGERIIRNFVEYLKLY